MGDKKLSTTRMDPLEREREIEREREPTQEHVIANILKEKKKALLALMEGMQMCSYIVKTFIDTAYQWEAESYSIFKGKHRKENRGKQIINTGSNVLLTRSWNDQEEEIT